MPNGIFFLYDNHTEYEQTPAVPQDSQQDASGPSAMPAVGMQAPTDKRASP